MNEKKQIMIVDDHPIVREGLRLLIDRQRDLAVCAEADNRAEAVQQIAQRKPDLAVVDLALKDGSGLDLIRDLHRRYPRLSLLALSMLPESLYAARAIQAGAKGYVMKQEASEKIVEAIRCILSDHVYLSEPMRARLIDGLGGGVAATDQPPVAQLSDRALEVFRLLGDGLPTREIAARLHLSVKTVETYFERIKERLNLQNFNQLLREAALWAHSLQGPYSGADGGQDDASV